MKERLVKYPLKYAQDFMREGWPVFPEGDAIHQARRLSHAILEGKTLQDVEDYLAAAVLSAHAKAGFDDYLSIVTKIALDVTVVAIYEKDIKEKHNDRKRKNRKRTAALHHNGEFQVAPQ